VLGVLKVLGVLLCWLQSSRRVAASAEDSPAIVRRRKCTLWKNGSRQPL